MHIQYKGIKRLSAISIFSCLLDDKVLNLLKMDAYNSSDYLSTKHILNLQPTTAVNHYGAYTSIDKKTEFIDNFITYSILITSILGMLGNILCLILMLRQPLRGMPHSLLCAALGFVDLCYVLMQISNCSIRIATGKLATLLNSFSCKFVGTFTLCCLHLDCWILVGLSLERLVAIFWPLRVRGIITKSKIKKFLLAISIFFLLFHAESSVRYDLVEIRDRARESSTVSCQPVHFYGLRIRAIHEAQKLLSFTFCSIFLKPDRLSKI